MLIINIRMFSTLLNCLKNSILLKKQNKINILIGCQYQQICGCIEDLHKVTVRQIRCS